MRREAQLFVLLAAATLGGCGGGVDLDEAFGGRWEVVEHQEAPECGDPGPADPTWAAMSLEFVDLEGFVGITIARCEGGCDTPSAAVPLDVIEEDRIGGLDTQTGLFHSVSGEVCQSSLIDVDATLEGDRLFLEMRSYYGGLTPPADGDCEALVANVSDDLCDVQVTIEGVR